MSIKRLGICANNLNQGGFSWSGIFAQRLEEWNVEDPGFMGLFLAAIKKQGP